MSALSDGVSVLMGQWQLTIGVIAFVFVGQGLVRAFMHPIFGDGLTAGEYSSLGIAGWLAPTLIFSLTWMLWGKDHALPFGLLILIVLFLLLRRLKPDAGAGSVSMSFILALCIFVSIILRLAYISKAVFPLYFDSAQHYFIAKSIMGDAAGFAKSVTTYYYHLGFHFLTASIASIFHLEMTRVMLAVGQALLALIPFSLFFLVRYETKSGMAGWFAVALSAFGWFMPAHAVNWGKYPALMSLGLIPFVLALALLIWKNHGTLPARRRWSLYGIFGVSFLLAVFTHSRSMIVFGIALLAWIAAAWWRKLPQGWMYLVPVAVAALLALEVVMIRQRPILSPLFDPYFNKGIWVTVLALCLSLFAWRDHPRFTFAGVLFVCLLLGSVFIPMTVIPGYRDLTLLDRPFVEMILFLPLSVLGGLGLAGLENLLQGRFAWGRYAGMVAIGAVAINACFNYNLYPSDCCAIVGYDDAVAMAWVEDQVPVHARIGIASTVLKVMASESPEGDVGADAGVWITPLTGRTTFLLPNDARFDERSALDGLCELEIGYLYVGEVGQPFDADTIFVRPEWYKPLLSMPGTRVYEVIGCDK